jgi:tetratricopeptide (TPR) repeat protein
MTLLARLDEAARTRPRRAIILAAGTVVLLAVLRPGIAYLNVWRGEQLAINRSDSHAITQFERATLIDPDYAFAWDSLGFTYARDDRPSDSIDAYVRALSLDSDNHPGRQHLVAILLGEGRAAEAVEQARTLVDLDGSLYGQWRLLAQSLKAEDRPSEAVQVLEEALLVFPDRTEDIEPFIAEIEESMR